MLRYLAGTVGILVYVALVIIGWVYYSKIYQDRDEYNESTVTWALTMAIVGIVVPVLEVVPPILYTTSCAADPVTTMVRGQNKTVRFREPKSRGKQAPYRKMNLQVR